MSKFLVTGGAGFIGSHITELLVKEGHEVAIFDNFSSGSKENLSTFADKVSIIEGDIRDINALTNAFVGFDYVIHQAAEISTIKSIEEPAFTNDVNVGGTLNVLVAARDTKVKRVVFASSCAIYGDTGNNTQHEGLVPNPLSPYGATKIAGEYYMSVFNHLYDLETVRLRYFNVFGPRQNPHSQYAAVIPKFITRILNGQEIRIYGDGEQTRDFIYVENIARANYLACSVPGVAGGVFNIGSGKTRTVNELASYLKDLSQKDIEVIHDAPIVGEIKYSSSDVSLSKEKLGFEASIGFAEGLKRTFDYLASKSRR